MTDNDLVPENLRTPRRPWSRGERKGAALAIIVVVAIITLAVVAFVSGGV